MKKILSILFISSSLVFAGNNNDIGLDTAKNAHTWTQIPETLERCLQFYLNTNFGEYLNTFLIKLEKQFYLS